MIIIIIITPGPRDAEDQLAIEQHTKCGELFYRTNWFKYGDFSEFRGEGDRSAKADNSPLPIS